MSQHYDFTVIPSDDPDVREADRGFLTEISWTVTAPEGGKSHGVRRVLITADMGAIVHLGLLAQPEPVPPYTGGYALAPDLAAEVATRAAADAALDVRVGALEVAPPAHTHPLADVTDAGTAAAADVGDFATAAQGVKADTALQPNTVTGLLAGNGTTTTGRTITGTADEITVTNGSGASGNPTLSLALTAAKVGALPIPDPGSFYPTDTITAALQLIGGRERRAHCLGRHLLHRHRWHLRRVAVAQKDRGRQHRVGRRLRRHREAADHGNHAQRVDLRVGEHRPQERCGGSDRQRAERVCCHGRVLHDPASRFSRQRRECVNPNERDRHGHGVHQCDRGLQHRGLQRRGRTTHLRSVAAHLHYR